MSLVSPVPDHGAASWAADDRMVVSGESRMDDDYRWKSQR